MAEPKFIQGALKVGNKNIPTLNAGLAELTKCGCGIECDCYGYLTLPSWTDATGVRVDGYAVYIVDGVLTVDTKANVEAAIDAYKAM